MTARTDRDSDPPATPASPALSRDTERDLTPPDTDSTPAPSEGRQDSPGAGQSTLLSAGTASKKGQEARDPRVEELERRLEQLEARLKVLELARGAIDDPKRRALFWLGLLLALALGWQLRAFLD